jgi:hypothetical protein
MLIGILVVLGIVNALATQGLVKLFHGDRSAMNVKIQKIDPTNRKLLVVSRSIILYWF